MVKQDGLIAPHGGELIDLYILDEEERYNLVEKAKTLVKRELTERELADLTLLGMIITIFLISVLGYRLSIAVWQSPLDQDRDENLATTLRLYLKECTKQNLLIINDIIGVNSPLAESILQNISICPVPSLIILGTTINDSIPKY